MDAARNSVKSAREQIGKLSKTENEWHSAQRRHQHTVESVTKARHHQARVLGQFGIKSHQASEATLELARAEHREKNAAEAASDAHKLSFNERKLARIKVRESIESNRLVVPGLRHEIAALKDSRAFIEGRRGALEKVINKEHSLRDATNAIKTGLKQAKSLGGDQWVRSLREQSRLQVEAGQKGHGLEVRLEGLEEKYKRVKQEGVGGFRAIKREMRSTELQLERLNNMRVRPFAFPKSEGGTYHGGPVRQAGGFVSRSALTMVGEAGPELVTLPYGARVWPHGATPRGDGRVNRVAMGAAQRGGKTYLAPVVLRVGRRKLAEVMAETQEDERARQ
jgi:hypothetical protein